MKRNDTRTFDPVQNQCNIARATDDLRTLSNQIGTQIRNEVSRAVASARAEDGTDILASKHFKELGATPFARAGKVAKGRDDIRTVECLESQALQFAATLLQQFRLDVAGRRNNANRVAGAQGRWFNHGVCS